ncbi:hypothetical protein WS45_04835 [Burkholderia sp. RF2-non_BP3]|nr:hypothetical protein WS45_04835 [Burkholderia sp. RF2-non_BP3]
MFQERICFRGVSVVPDAEKQRIGQSDAHRASVRGRRQTRSRDGRQARVSPRPEENVSST